MSDDRTEPEAQVPPRSEWERRSLYRHPMAALGGALIVAGILAFVILFFFDRALGDNPYRSLVTFIAVPFIITVGVVLFLIAARIQVMRARRSGDRVRFMLRVEPSDPRYMRNLWLFLGLSVVILVMVAYSGLRAFHATESVGFCGDTCHEVMGPQNTTFANSAHARVPCVECHIGPGGSFWVQSKIDGIRQVWKTTFNSYDRPIKTPVESLRPAQETCEECHWPLQFYGQKLSNINYYRTDELNSPWTISLLVNVGGGNPRTGDLEGIHWHMITDNTIEYIATDDRRQEIPWVKLTDGAGNVKIYSDPLEPIDPTSEEYEVRRFDCIDCHNRPSHTFEPPATAINRGISRGEISAELPFIRQIGLDLLNAEYETTSGANAAIPAELNRYYRDSHPEEFDALRDEIVQATESLLGIYNANFFPEMKTDYRVRLNNLSHFVNDGCFRCHFTDLTTPTGERMSADCNSCHTIVAQGPTDDLSELESGIAGLEFEHPVQIGEVWRTVKCTQCHTPAQGY